MYSFLSYEMKKTFAIALIFFAGIFALIWVVVAKPLDASSQKTTTFSVVKGEGSRDISYNLEHQGFISWAPLFRIYALTIGASHRLQAGDYELSPALSMRQIVKKFVEGDVIKEKITVIEGWSVQDIAKALEEKKLASADEFIEKFSRLEGYLFPDTYEIQPSASIDMLVESMQDNFKKKTASLEQQIRQSTKTLDDTVIMASLLEKEVRSPEDKKLVSDILWRRLKAGIALQVDAAPDTYTYRGLPKRPIGNPGLESIRAALEPQSNPYWYYLSKPTGETVFSKTLTEHNLAKAMYLK
ncbi:MAG: endolytic transglycosylase MltG [Candidatus Wildermuthbacteria bacterium]|nr:endolytic transglycosylase MltG [Candidatus Wildermuthbacteria bacterium]